jgi:excisionase family DNA binding protein
MKTLDLKEAASYLKIHPVTMQRMAKSKTIRGAKVGKSWVFFEVDLVSYLNALMDADVLDVDTQKRKRGRQPSHPPLSETLPKFYR